MLHTTSVGCCLVRSYRKISPQSNFGLPHRTAVAENKRRNFVFADFVGPEPLQLASTCSICACPAATVNAFLRACCDGSLVKLLFKVIRSKPACRPVAPALYGVETVVDCIGKITISLVVQRGTSTLTIAELYKYRRHIAEGMWPSIPHEWQSTGTRSQQAQSNAPTTCSIT